MRASSSCTRRFAGSAKHRAVATTQRCDLILFGAAEAWRIDRERERHASRPVATGLIPSSLRDFGLPDIECGVEQAKSAQEFGRS